MKRWRKKSESKYVKKYGLSSDELAKELGVTPATVLRWLKTPSMDNLIIKKLGLPRKYADFIER